MQATIQTLLVGTPVDHPADPSRPGALGRPWRSAFIKQPVDGDVPLSPAGLDGDGPADLENHGGPDKAVNAYPTSRHPHWRTAYPDHAFDAGAFGENLALGGVDESVVCIGDTFTAATGGAVLQVSQPRQPCWKLARRHGLADLPKRVTDSGYSGWYFRVLNPGHLAAGTVLTRTANPHPELTVLAANRAFYHPADHPNLAHRLVDCPALSTAWRSALAPRLSRSS